MATVSERDAAKETGRLETFADGVFAIAITLLVLEIRIPDVGEDLGKALPAQWPSFAAYVTSFLTIGVMWVSHHQMFTIIRRTTPTFLFLNVLFLLPVAFVPYPTALVAGHIQEPQGRTTAVLVYGAVSVVIAVMFNVLWAYAFRRGLVVPGTGADRARSVARGFIVGPLIYLGATLLAFVNPFISMAVFAGLAVYWMLPGKIPSG
jgi:TMEM175 potassium channel family protein